MNRQFEYKTSLDSLHFTPEQKARIASQAAASARRETRHTRRPVRRMGLIAAALVAVLAVGTAGATGVLKSAAESFAGIFGGNVAQTEVIDKIGRPIGAFATDNGVTITADAILGDQYNAAIVYSISRVDGASLLPEGVNIQNLMMDGFDGVSLSLRGGSHGSAWFVDEDPTDNAIQMVATISADTPIAGATARAVFEDLGYWDEDAEEKIPLVEGTWKVSFDVDYEDISVALGSGETFVQDGMTFTVDAVSVSPVAVKVDYTVDREVQWSDTPSGRQSDEDSREAARYLENVEILLTRTDGTVIDLTNAGGSIKPENGVTVCSKSRVLDEIIPMEELESISVGGVVLSLGK